MDILKRNELNGNFFNNEENKDKFKKIMRLSLNFKNEYRYFSNQVDIISEIFKKKDILTKIVILNSFYSTNLEKKKYKMDDLEIKLKEYKIENLEKDILKYLKNQEGDLKKIFEENYGLEGNKAVSFLSKKKFPIYDELVISSLKNLKITEKKLSTENFFKNINLIREKLEEFNFSELDFFFWIYGKIRKLSFTTFLNKKQYKEFEEENSNLFLKNKLEKIDFFKKFNLDKFEEIMGKLNNLEKLNPK
jgi:hypothetical protein